jgi:GxxExxY protein
VDERHLGFPDGSGAVIGAMIEVHRALGPGLLESTYEACLAREFSLRRIPFEEQKTLGIRYKGLVVESAYRLDFLVNGRLVIELKAVEQLLPVHTAQLLTYLKLGQLSAGLLVNFNVALLKDGLRRFWNYRGNLLRSPSLLPFL